MSVASRIAGGPGRNRVVRVPALRLSLRVRPRAVAVCAGLVVIALVLLVLAVGTGEYPIPPGEVVATLLGGGDPGTSFVIETLRLPRALTALLVGGALGCAGAIFQSLTRNPLGSPDIIGFTSGASAAAVFMILVFGGGTAAIAAGAVVGGLVTALLVVVLAARGGLQGYRIILVGIGINAMLYALTDYLLTRARLEEAQSAAVWLTGSLNGRGWEHVEPLAVALAVLLPLVALLAGPLRMLELGDEAAVALGVGVRRARLALIVVGVALTAVAVAAAGPIAFVALAAPQLARRLTRSPGPNAVAATLMGAVLLAASDLAAQRLFPDHALPVGVATGVIGGLYLIWLLSHEWRSARA